MDVLSEAGDFDVPPASRLERRTVPAALPQLAAAILAAPRDRFAVVASEEVTASGATDALVGFAERLGCPVYGAPMHSTQVFPTAHPLWAGAVPADAVLARELLAELDTVLLIGSRGFMTFSFRDVWPVPEQTHLLHLSPAADDLGRTYPTELGVVGDPQATLQALMPLLVGVDDDEVAGLTEAIGARGEERLSRMLERAGAAERRRRADAPACCHGAAGCVAAGPDGRRRGRHERSLRARISPHHEAGPLPVLPRRRLGLGLAGGPRGVARARP